MSSPKTKRLFEEPNMLLESAIELKLQLSYEERVEAHENARRLMLDLQEAGEQLNAKPQSTP